MNWTQQHKPIYHNSHRDILRYEELAKTLPCSKDAHDLIRFKIREMKEYAQYGSD